MRSLDVAVWSHAQTSLHWSSLGYPNGANNNSCCPRVLHTPPPDQQDISGGLEGAIDVAFLRVWIFITGHPDTGYNQQAKLPISLPKRPIVSQPHCCSVCVDGSIFLRET